MATPWRSPPSEPVKISCRCSPSVSVVAHQGTLIGEFSTGVHSRAQPVHRPSHRQVTRLRVLLPTANCLHDGVMFTTAAPERSGPAWASGSTRVLRGLRSADRRRLERAGWRTTLDFRENHRRGEGGRLVQVETSWLAEAERIGEDGVDVVCASSRNESRAWAKVLAAVEAQGSIEASRAHELGVRDRRPIS